jgi:hypothetical protein
MGGAPGCARGAVCSKSGARWRRGQSRARAARLEESARRLEEEFAVEHLANAAYEAWRERGTAADGTRLAPGSTKPYRPPALPAGTINTTDPDARLVNTFGQKAVQGYNAQAAVNEHQILVAAEVTVVSPDFGHLEPDGRCNPARARDHRRGVTGGGRRRRRLLAHTPDGESG